MKEEVLKALAYPRSLVSSDLELENCGHAGNYSRDHQDCQGCDQGAECEWLYSNDEFIALQEKSVRELESALEFALGYVDARMTRSGHKPLECKCEACAWLKQSQKLFDEVVTTTWGS